MGKTLKPLLLSCEMEHRTFLVRCGEYNLFWGVNCCTNIISIITLD
mgnify:CR=1 FL=1